MPNFAGEIEIVSIATLFLLLVTVAPILFTLMHQRQYHRYLRDNEKIRNLYQRELLQSQLEIQNQTLQQISGELHDHIGQLLTVALMRLNSLEDDLTEPTTRRAIQQTRELISTIINDVRTLSKTLDYDVVRRFGLVPSLTLELEHIRRTGRVQIQLLTTGEPYSLGEQAETVLLRMAQESLNNALKHARARTLTIAADYQPGTFTLSITDDGRGFRPEEAAARSLDEAGSGLPNLSRRAGLLGGTCTITSRMNEGTQVEIRLPRHRPV